jgi:hypothetical protein
MTKPDKQLPARELQTPYERLIDHFGSVKRVAHALDVTTGAVYLWDKKIPAGRAYQVEVKTNGFIKAEEILSGLEENGRANSY